MIASVPLTEHLSRVSFVTIGGARPLRTQWGAVTVTLFSGPACLACRYVYMVYAGRGVSTRVAQLLGQVAVRAAGASAILSGHDGQGRLAGLQGYLTMC